MSNNENRKEPPRGPQNNGQQGQGRRPQPGGYYNGGHIPPNPNNEPSNNKNPNKTPNNHGGNNNGDDNKDNKKKMAESRIMMLVIAFVAVLIFSTLTTTLYENMTTEEITYNKFLDMVEDGKVESISIDNGRIIIKPKDKGYVDYTYWTAQMDDIYLVERLEKSGVEYKAEYVDTSTSIWSFLFAWVVPFVIIYGVMFLVFKKVSKGGGLMGSVGKSNAKIYDMQKETGVTFKDVAGQDEAKEMVSELVDFLHNPDKYAKIGAKLPKGALLVGPPGTGKTLLAKAVAGEAKVPFFSLSGSDFVEMYVGVGASRVRDLFKQAQQNAPCIIFIDEVDAIGKSRDSRHGGSNDEREQTLNQLLSEMDGFDSSKGVLILAATNRPEVLDPALLRPGRFDRRVIVDKPDLKGRLETLKVHSKNVIMDETVNLEEIALATSGAVGSDLANMINEAAILAVKNKRPAISQADLFESVEVVIAGKEKKDRILGETEKKTVAYHEVGHALATALQKDAEPVQKITIVPRTMGSLGYVMQVPEEEKYLMTKKELEAKLVTLLAGRAAEEIVFDTITTGASNDIERATSIAKSMIAQYGMSQKLGLMSLESIQDPYLGAHSQLNCSQDTAAVVEQEVQKLLSEKYEEAKKMLEANRDALDEIASFLFEKETITGKQFMEIFNKVKNKNT